MRHLSHPSAALMCVAALAWLPAVAPSPQAALQPQTDTFGSNASISAQQSIRANLDQLTAQNVQIAVEFERSNWANGSVASEPFYRLPPNASAARPGALLKLQQDANTSAYTLPPATALSRFMYQTADLNGTAVPTTGYVLWPYLPRRQPDGSWPVVAWGHGTSGEFAECGPSHIRNLWYQFTTPYILALQGYVVVATDYAGLGLNHTADGTPVLHQYLASPAAANDVIYSVQAARSAFPQLSREFVVAGHSQGGAAAWAAAQRQAQQPIDGYLGAIAASPLSSLTRLLETDGPAAGAAGALLAHYFPALFPGFRPSDFLSPDGEKRAALFAELGGCNSVATELLPYDNASLYQPDWYRSDWLQAWERLTANGGKPVGGPLLILQGSIDPVLHENVTDAAVRETCDAYPDSQIQYFRYNGTTHSSTMYVSQQQWLDWIADRFAHKSVQHACQTTNFTSARDDAFYQKELNWFLEPALSGYEVA